MIDGMMMDEFINRLLETGPDDSRLLTIESLWTLATRMVDRGHWAGLSAMTTIRDFLNNPDFVRAASKR